MSGVKDKRIKKKSSTERKRTKDKVHEVDQSSNREESYENKLSRKKKRRNNQKAENETVAANKLYMEDGFGKENLEGSKAADKHKKRERKKREKNEEKAALDKFDNEAVDDPEQQNESTLSETQAEIESHEENNGTNTVANIKTSKSKKSRKKNHHLVSSREDKNLSENRDSIVDDVYQISSGDEDYSKGMKKWFTEYHQSRPGLDVLQERIDDFITEHEARVEQERKEKEAQAAEDGWTVVVHQKGRKKTTDAESGVVVVGSVAQATVLDNMTKKKNKQVGLDFYRFQKREAHRSEIMMLQSKFEEDKKRIHQIRAARKFRPY